MIEATAGPGQPLRPERPPQSERNAELWDLAQQLEASFLSEMLKSAGFGAAREALGGGVGEEQFASLLRDEHARALVDRGGIGLAQNLFEALKDRADAN